MHCNIAPLYGFHLLFRSSEVLMGEIIEISHQLYHLVQITGALFTLYVSPCCIIVCLEITRKPPIEQIHFCSQHTVNVQEHIFGGFRWLPGNIAMSRPSDCEVQVCVSF